MAEHLSEEERRLQIVNATLEIIYREGLDRLTLDRISKQAQCSKGVAAYYFKTKDNLILEAYRAYLTYYQKKTALELSKATGPTSILQILLDVSFPKRYDPSLPHTPINISAEVGGMDEHQEAFLFMHFFAAALTNETLQAILKEVYATDTQGIGSLFDYVQQMQGIVPEADFTNAERAYGFLSMIVGMSFLRVGSVFPEEETSASESLDRRLLKAYLTQLANGKA